MLPTVARRVCDLENLVNEEAIARVGLQRHLKNYYYYYYYYYLTAIGLTPGGSSTVHIYTQNSTQNAEDGAHITIYICIHEV
jgi:hypothetical protein